MTMDDREKLIHNEQTKLYATFVNNTGLAIIAAGAFSFLSRGFTDNLSEHRTDMWIAQAIAICLGLGCHFTAKKALENLVD
jgi:hypothetical protein